MKGDTLRHQSVRMRERYAEGGITLRALAIEFGVSSSRAGQIIKKAAPPKDMEALFNILAPGNTMIYFTGASLVGECRDGAEDVLEKVEKMRALREWAATKAQLKDGFLTQKKFNDLYDYRLTKAKGPN